MSARAAAATSESSRHRTYFTQTSTISSTIDPRPGLGAGLGSWASSVTVKPGITPAGREDPLRRTRKFLGASSLGLVIVVGCDAPGFYHLGERGFRQWVLPDRMGRGGRRQL